MRTSRSLFVAGALALLALAGCTIRTEREELLPWLLRKSSYRAFGGFGDSTHVTFYAKHWGFWRTLDAWNAVPLDADHAFVENEHGCGFVTRGSLRTTLVCERGMSKSVALPPGPPALDCVEAVAHESGVTGLLWRRFDARGRQVGEQTIPVVGPSRVFAPPADVFAYDEEGVPYFLMLDRDAQADYRVAPRRCALASTRHNEPSIEGPESMGWDDCRRAEAWQAAAGRRLYDAWTARDAVRAAGSARSARP